MEIHSVFIASERVTIRKDDLPNFSISCQIIICFKEFFLVPTNILSQVNIIFMIHMESVLTICSP